MRGLAWGQGGFYYSCYCLKRGQHSNATLRSCPMARALPFCWMLNWGSARGEKLQHLHWPCGSRRASRRPISCVREWKHLEEIFPFTASAGTHWPWLVFYGPLCTSNCHGSSCGYTSSHWWDRGGDSQLSESCTLHPVFWLSSMSPHEPVTFCHFFHKISGSIGQFFQSSPFLPDLPSPQPQGFWYSPPTYGTVV